MIFYDPIVPMWWIFKQRTW